MSHIPVRPLRSWATLLLVLGLCSLLAADHGPRQRALDLWMTYRDADAAAAGQAAGAAGAAGGAAGGQSAAADDDNVVDAEVKEVKKD